MAFAIQVDADPGLEVKHDTCADTQVVLAIASAIVEES
jgi:hypothetical protein